MGKTARRAFKIGFTILKTVKTRFFNTFFDTAKIENHVLRPYNLLPNLLTTPYVWSLRP